MKENIQNTEGKIVWAFSGGAARFIALARAAEVCMSQGTKPDIIIGTSSGSLLAPIIAVSYSKPELMAEAIEFGETLDVQDMFPYKGNKPFNKKGKITWGAIGRIITGYSHFGIQDIKPMYKKVFTEQHFLLLQGSDIKCYAFGVNGQDGTTKIVCLNDAKSLDDMIDMIELSSRIVPFVQPAEFDNQKYVDGGFISFNPAMWLFNQVNIKELITIYSKPVTKSIAANSKWDDNVLSVTTQMLHTTTHWLGVKDSIIEELFCKLHNIPYLRIECPDGIIDEIYETDDDQLIALGLAAKEIAEELWFNYKLTKINDNM